jgi:hypothetical protein
MRHRYTRNRPRVCRLCASCVGSALSLAALWTVTTSPWVGEALTLSPEHIALRVDTGGRLGLSAPLPPLAAGDEQQRMVTLRNDDRSPIDEVTLGVLASGSSPSGQATRMGSDAVSIAAPVRGYRRAPGRCNAAGPNGR